jgi:transcriptional regulator with XRE-family HTH domain
MTKPIRADLANGQKHPTPIDIARQFHEVRKRRAMTQDRLSDLTGVAKSEISRMERGWATPTGRTLDRLAQALDVRMVLIPRDDTAQVEATARLTSPGRRRAG